MNNPIDPVVKDLDAKPVIQLVASDLDATLLGPDGQISKENAQAVAEIQRRGIKFLLASGRLYQQMIGYHRQLGLKGPIVTSNGALVLLGRKTIHEDTIPRKAAGEILNYAATNNMTAMSYLRSGVRVSSRHYWNVSCQKHLDEGTVAVTFCKPEDLNRSRIHQMMLYDCKQTLDQVYNHLTTAYQDQLNIIRIADEMIAMNPLGADKAKGIAAIATHYGIDRHRVAVFGDGTNDITMFKWAGLSICMHHGHPDARQAADLIAPPSSPETNFAAAVAAMFQLIDSCP